MNPDAEELFIVYHLKKNGSRIFMERAAFIPVDGNAPCLKDIFSIPGVEVVYPWTFFAYSISGSISKLFQDWIEHNWIGHHYHKSLSTRD